MDDIDGEWERRRRRAGAAILGALLSSVVLTVCAFGLLMGRPADTSSFLQVSIDQYEVRLDTFRTRIAPTLDRGLAGEEVRYRELCFALCSPDDLAASYTDQLAFSGLVGMVDAEMTTLLSAPVALPLRWDRQVVAGSRSGVVDQDLVVDLAARGMEQELISDAESYLPVLTAERDRQRREHLVRGLASVVVGVAAVGCFALAVRLAGRQRSEGGRRARSQAEGQHG